MNCLWFPLFPDNATLFGSPVLSDLSFWIVGGLTAWYGFYQYRKTKRSEAATRMMAGLNSCINYVEEVVLRPSLYLYDGYYPDGIPETASRARNIPSYGERPSRLIINRIYAFDKELADPLAQIAGKEAKELLKLKLALQRTARNLSNSIGAQFNSTQEIAAAMEPNIAKCCESLKAIQAKFEILLVPIIEGRGPFFVLGKKIMSIFKDDGGIKPIIICYFWGLVRAIILTLIAYFAAHFIKAFYPLSKLCVDWIQVLGIMCAVAALYGKSGWEIQTWGGNSPAEKWDMRFEYIFQSLGYLVAIFGLILAML